MSNIVSTTLRNSLKLVCNTEELFSVAERILFHCYCTHTINRVPSIVLWIKASAKCINVNENLETIANFKTFFFSLVHFSSNIQVYNISLHRNVVYDL